jgi:hypothetical protein
LPLLRRVSWKTNPGVIKSKLWRLWFHLYCRRSGSLWVKSAWRNSVDWMHP